VKTDTAEQFIASLEVEQHQSYRHFPNTNVNYPVTLGTTLHPE